MVQGTDFIPCFLLNFIFKSSQKSSKHTLKVVALQQIYWRNMSCKIKSTCCIKIKKTTISINHHFNSFHYLCIKLKDCILKYLKKYLNVCITLKINAYKPIRLSDFFFTDRPQNSLASVFGVFRKTDIIYRPNT